MNVPNNIQDKYWILERVHSERNKKMVNRKISIIFKPEIKNKNGLVYLLINRWQSRDSFF